MYRSFNQNILAGAISALLCSSSTAASAEPPTVLTPWAPEISSGAGVYDRRIASFRLVGKVGNQASAAHTPVRNPIIKVSYNGAGQYGDITNIDFDISALNTVASDCVPGGYLKISADSSKPQSCFTPKPIHNAGASEKMTVVSLK